MKRKMLPFCLALFLILSACQNSASPNKEYSLWQAFNEQNQEIAQLVLTEQSAEIYFYSYEFSPRYNQEILKQCFYLYYDITTDAKGNITGKLAESDYYYQAASGEYLEIPTCQIQKNEQSLNLSYPDIPNEVAASLPHSFTLVTENKEAVLLNRPFYRDDVDFGFERNISIAEFIAEYGKPNGQTSEEVWDADYQAITFTYDWGSIQWLYYVPADTYNVISFSATSAEMCPTIRNIYLGMDFQEAIKNFRLDYAADVYTLDPHEAAESLSLAADYYLYGEERRYYWRLYGESLHWNSYGSIEAENTLKYVNGLDVLYLEFTEEKLSKITYIQAFD